jgi:hypothetical protein
MVVPLAIATAILWSTFVFLVGYSVGAQNRKP